MRIGCHISVGKGFYAAVEQAHALDADCFQYFTKSPRALRFSKTLDEADAERGRRQQDAWNLVSLGHAPYLINLSAPETDMRQASVDALAWDLHVAAVRGSFAVVVHCGKHKGAGPQQGMAWMRDALAQVLAQQPPGVRLLLENTAGQGTEIGSTVEDLIALVDGLAPPERLGFCLDTQHAFAAGILDPADPAGFPGFTEPAYRDRLFAVHLNDSKVPFGSRVDRHAKIGTGFIGRDGIANILRTPALRDLPCFLETPVDDEREYGPEIALCRQLAGLA